MHQCLLLLFILFHSSCLGHKYELLLVNTLVDDSLDFQLLAIIKELFVILCDFLFHSLEYLNDDS
jgi:hypothetical protein